MFKKIMLDSGAYTIHMNPKSKLTIDGYIQFLHDNAYLFDELVSFDAIGDAKQSYKNWVRIKAEGHDVIPVFHIGTDEKYLKKYLKQTDYIGIGAIANLSSTQRSQSLDRVWTEYLTNEKGVPIVKTHGMGITAMDMMLRYPWHTVDSANASLSAAFGKVFLPGIRGNIFNYYQMGLYGVSASGKQNRGFGNYHTLPKILRTKYEQLFAELGYLVGSVEDKKPEAGVGLFTEVYGVENKSTLAGWHMERFKLNLDMLFELSRVLPSSTRPLFSEFKEVRDVPDRTKLMMSIASSSYISEFLKHDKWVNGLISYAYAGETVLEDLKENYKNK